MASLLAGRIGGITRRRVIGGLTGSMLALPAACGPVGGGGTGSTPAKERITLQFLAPAGSIDEANTRMMPVWNEKNPTIGIQWAYTPNGPQDVIAHGAAGDLEDMVAWWMGGQNPQSFFAWGFTAPLDAYVRGHKVNPKDWYSGVWQGHFLDGKQFSLPWQGQVFGLALYFNKNVFDEAGIKYPDLNTSMDELVNMAEKLKIVQGSEVLRWGMVGGEESATTSLNGERMPSHARQFNAEMFSADQKQFTWGVGPEFLACLNWYTEMMQKRVGVYYSRGSFKADPQMGDPTIEPQSQYGARLLSGKAAMAVRGWMGGTGAYAGYIKNNPQARYGMTFTPKGPTGRRGGWITSAASSLSKTSKHPDQAFSFLVDFSGHDWSIARGLQQTGSTTLNGRPDVYHDPQLVQEPFFPKDVITMKAAAMDYTEKGEDCSYSRGVAWNFQDAKIWDAERQTIYKIATGELPGSQNMVTQLRGLVDPVMQLPRPALADVAKK
jgi:ABC-type glycerol-3-phosphate transport system substrate-binding protein